MKSLDELSRIESVGAKNKGKQEDKVSELVQQEKKKEKDLSLPCKHLNNTWLLSMICFSLEAGTDSLDASGVPREARENTGSNEEKMVEAI